MERRVRGNSHARCGVGENSEIISKNYLSLFPGAFSSGSPKGEDFRIVLEEIVGVKFHSVSIPGPDTGRWESAGCILLGDSFSLAWRVLDAQYWGVPQRRRRIYLVADFGGTTAPKILFNQESLPRDYSPGIRAREAITTPAPCCP